MGLLSEIISYQEASLEARMKIFRVSKFILGLFVNEGIKEPVIM